MDDSMSELSGYLLYVLSIRARGHWMRLDISVVDMYICSGCLGRICIGGVGKKKGVVDLERGEGNEQ